MKDDLISRSALLKDLCNSCDGWCDNTECDCLNCKSDHRCDMVQDIADAPAVDAEKVFEAAGLVKEAFDMAKSNLAPAQKWISVKDRLPETESRCLVIRYDAVTKTSFRDILWFDKGTWWNRIFGGEYSVTHWMPLPEPPEEG